MSNLKYLSVKELEVEKEKAISNIKRFNSLLTGQKVRLEWIEKYLFEKTPQELSIEEIEARLGHKVIIK